MSSRCYARTTDEMDELRGAMQAVGIQPSENGEEFFVGRANPARGLQTAGAATAG